MELKGREIRVSVRNLVEFVLRSGDIDNRRTAGRQREAMEAGSRLHRKIQKRMGPDYRAEVALKHRVEEEGFSLLIEGRADEVAKALAAGGVEVRERREDNGWYAFTCQ